MGNFSGLIVDGAARFDRAGREVSSAGDVNGDGVDDFIVASDDIGTNGEQGAAFVIFGQADDGFPASLSLADINGTNGFEISQSEFPSNGNSNGFGAVTASIGDINNDGVGDIFVGGNEASGYYGGNLGGYVIYGRDTETEGAFDEIVDVTNLDATDGFAITGLEATIQDAQTGDFNGDGIDDLLLNSASNYSGYYGGELGYIGGSDTAGYVIFGSDDIDASDTLNVGSLNGANGFSIQGGNQDIGGFYGNNEINNGFINAIGGGGVTNLGDVNGDGFDDIGLAVVNSYIGQEELDDGEGGTYTNYYAIVDRSAYALFGGATAPATKSGPANGVQVFWDNLSYASRYDYFDEGGYFFNQSPINVTAIGDVNGDGFDDVLISTTNRVLLGEFSPVAEDGDDARGVAGIVFGGPDGIDTDGDGPLDGLNSRVSLAARDADGNPSNPPDVTIVNSDPDANSFGATIAAAGDVNGDGAADFLISTGFNNSAQTAADTFLVFGPGSDAGNQFPAVLDLNNLTQPEIDETFYKFVLPVGNDSGNNFFGRGITATAAGDVNGDGFDDIIITQPYLNIPGVGDTTDGTDAGRTYVVFGGADALEAVDNADGANDNTINVANLGVNVDTGELPIQVSVANQGFLLRQSEGDAGATVFEFTVQRSGDLTEIVSFDFEVTGSGFDVAEADDFVGGVLPSGSVSFDAGSATAVVEIEVQGDNIIEGNEDFTFTISNPTTDGPSDISLGIDESFATIRNDDVPASLRVFGQSGSEDGTLTFTVLRSGDLQSDVAVDFALTGFGFSAAVAADIGGVNVDGVDIGGGIGQTGTLNFAAGETSKVIIVMPVDDPLIEPSEGVELTISNAQASGPVVISDDDAVAFITNNDFPPQILVEGGGFVTEGSGAGFTPITFTIVRRGETDGVTEVTYDLNPLPSPGDFFAADSNDIDGFLPSFGNVVRFEDGETSKTVTVNVNRDGIIEPRESFELRVTSVESFNGFTYSVVNPSRSATILNDDGRPPVTPPGVEADVFGDPHIVTLDGLGYDFQAVGEFILVESTIPSDPRDFQVQVRFEPLPGSDLVSVTTRMSVDVGGKTIEIDALGSNALLVDGVPVSVEDLVTGAIDVDGNGTLDLFETGPGEYTIVLNDLNEQLKVKNMDGVLNVCVFLSNEAGGHAGNVRGLMGNANGDNADDLMSRDGLTTFTDPTFDELYVTYADSWRVGGERNFTDAEGTGNFPASFPVAKISIDDLPPAVLAAAQAAVLEAGITDPILVENAILDFALTGNPNFIQGALGLAADPDETLELSDVPVLPLSIGVTPVETRVSEGDGNPNTLFYTFFRLGDDSSAVTIDYSVDGDVDAADLVAGTALTGQITIAEGVGSATLALSVVNDALTEGDEDLVVSITGNDAGALIASATGTTVIETDDFAPVAADDEFFASADDTVSGNVLAPNPTDADEDANGDTLTVLSAQNSDGGSIRTDGVAITLPSGATLVLRDDGTFDYDPMGAANSATDFEKLKAGEMQTETFTYIVGDGNGGTDEATVSITVTGVNDAPVALNAASLIQEDGSSNFGILSLISDIDGDALSLESLSVTAGATVEQTSDVTFSVTGDPNFFGDVVVTYSVTDGALTSNEATVSIVVNPVNDAPELEDAGPFSVAENTTTVGSIIASDIDSADLGYSIIGGDDAALFEIDEDTGELSFINAPDFEAPGDSGGDNSYEVQVQVSDNDLTDDAIVVVSVTDVDEGTNVIEITGTSGRDRLVGTDADEIFDGQGGSDLYTGGGGADTFVFNSNGVRDRESIRDFEAGVDSIQLDTGFAVRFTSRYASITTDDGDQIRVYGNAETEEDLSIMVLADTVF